MEQHLLEVIFQNSLNVLNNLIGNNNVTCKSLNLSNDLLINSNSVFNNKINISGSTIILGNSTINSNINICGNINLPYIPNYIDNGIYMLFNGNTQTTVYVKLINNLLEIISETNICLQDNILILLKNDYNSFNIFDKIIIGKIL